MYLAFGVLSECSQRWQAMILVFAVYVQVQHTLSLTQCVDWITNLLENLLKDFLCINLFVYLRQDSKCIHITMEFLGA